jgi:hypothetical protein
MLTCSARPQGDAHGLIRGNRLDMGDGVYHARLLRADEARAAYPLISLEHPEVTLPIWQAFVRRANRGGRHQRGLVAITDRRGSDWRRISRRLEGRFNFASDAEIAVEIDLRTFTPAHVEALASVGVNRAGIEPDRRRGRRLSEATLSRPK